ncbi:leucine-rich repeat and coiled-coil domain-containing protein 1-like [Saccoglossus kowalevskii]
MHDGRGNPVCQLPGYRSGVINSVPQLEILDGLDRNGEVANGDSGLSDIPGLEDYLEYLDSSDKQDNLLPLAFPKIDEALQQFRQRGCVSTDQSSTTDQEDMEIRIKATRMSPRFKSKPIPEKKVTTDHEVRIEKLEQELAQFLCVKDDNNKRGKGGETDTTESISSPEDSRHRYISNRKKNLLAAQRDVSTDESSKPSDTKGKKLRTSRIPTHSHQKKTVPAKPVKTARPKGSSNSTQVSSSPPSAGEQQTRRPTTVQDDEDKLCLMQELDNERERRWKAEQAARKLVDHIKEIQSKGNEQREVQDVAIETSTRLKQALVREREEKNRLEKLVSELEERVSKLTEKLESSQDSEESQRKALRAMETTATKIESEKIEQLAHERKKTQDYQMKAVAASREVDLLRNMVKKHEGKIQQLQELLASREQDHRHNMKNKYSLESRELQDVLTKAVNSEREKHELDVRLYKEKVDVLTHQYADLEDEFRLALQIEANRFKEVQEAFEKVSEESAQHKQAMVTLHDKEQKCSALVTELTSMVKEQKGRLSELSRSKQEALAEAKERLQTVEAHLDEARRRMVQMEMLKQEKTKLQAQITAQESLIEGLRVEKRLWSQELAQQGASLAQDRGRLDARVDALAAEVSSLKKQQERDQDALRIKCKMIEDQTETIKKLKEGLIERDAEIKEARDDSIKMQKSLEEQLSEEKITNQDLQDSVERLTERKEGLKQQLADTQIELDESRKAHQTLDKKWKDRAELIGTLEAQVKKVKENYDEKEKKLTKERDNAVSAEK